MFKAFIPMLLHHLHSFAFSLFYMFATYRISHAYFSRIGYGEDETSSSAMLSACYIWIWLWAWTITPQNRPQPWPAWHISLHLRAIIFGTTSALLVSLLALIPKHLFGYSNGISALISIAFVSLFFTYTRFSEPNRQPPADPGPSLPKAPWGAPF